MKFKNFENASQSYYRPSMPLDVIQEVRKQLQKDLLGYLDDRDPRMKNRVCEIVVENFNKLLPPEEE